MDFLSAISTELGADLVGDATCAEYLQIPTGNELDVITPLPADASVLESAVRQVYRINAQEQQECSTSAVGIQCKQIGASAYCTLSNSPDFNGAMGAL